MSNKNGLEKGNSGSSKTILVIVTTITIFALISGAAFFGYTAAKKPKEATLKLEEFLVNLSDDGKAKYLKVNMFLGSDGKNKDLQKELTAKVPQIRDCINNTLRTKKSTDFTTEGEARLKEEIIVKINETLSNGKVADVYFSSIIVQ